LSKAMSAKRHATGRVFLRRSITRPKAKPGLWDFFFVFNVMPYRRDGYNRKHVKKQKTSEDIP
jgi:hypothetical protein